MIGTIFFDEYNFRIQPVTVQAPFQGALAATSGRMKPPPLTWRKTGRVADPDTIPSAGTSRREAISRESNVPAATTADRGTPTARHLVCKTSWSLNGQRRETQPRTLRTCQTAAIHASNVSMKAAALRSAGIGRMARRRNEFGNACWNGTAIKRIFPSTPGRGIHSPRAQNGRSEGSGVLFLVGGQGDAGAQLLSPWPGGY